MVSRKCLRQFQTDEGNEVRANYSSQEPILVYPQHFRRDRRLRRPANPTISVGDGALDAPHQNAVGAHRVRPPPLPYRQKNTRPKASNSTAACGRLRENEKGENKESRLSPPVHTRDDYIFEWKCKKTNKKHAPESACLKLNHRGFVFYYL